MTSDPSAPNSSGPNPSAQSKALKNKAHKNKADPNKASPRSAARLAAVQALYQIEQSNDPVIKVIADFRAHRLGHSIEDEAYIKADSALFGDLVAGTAQRLTEIDTLLTAHLASGWSLDRLDSVIRQALRVGAYELLARPDTPTAVILNEYVDVAKAFAQNAEARFVNGILDKLAHTLNRFPL
jgi:transcription antitermination protein NusB